MGAVCCRSQPIDFDGEVTLFHFRLLKVVGKGAFGKVCPTLSLDRPPSPRMSPGPNGSTQTDPGNVRAQVYQQNEGREDEGGGQYHPGAEASREGRPQAPHHSPPTELICACRLTTPLSSTFGTPSRMTRTVSSS